MKPLSLHRCRHYSPRPRIAKDLLPISAEARADHPRVRRFLIAERGPVP